MLAALLSIGQIRSRHRVHVQQPLGIRRNMALDAKKTFLLATLHCNTAASVFLTIYASMIKNAAPDFFPGHANLFFAACSSRLS